MTFPTLFGPKIFEEIEAGRSLLASGGGSSPQCRALIDACTAFRNDEWMSETWQNGEARLMIQAAVMHASKRRICNELRMRLQLATWFNQTPGASLESNLRPWQKESLMDSRIFEDVMSLKRRLRTMEQRLLPIYGDPAHTGFLRKSFDRITGVKKIYFGATITEYSLFMKPLG